jgi:hypothetical protein
MLLSKLTPKMTELSEEDTDIALTMTFEAKHPGVSVTQSLKRHLSLTLRPIHPERRDKLWRAQLSKAPESGTTGRETRSLMRDAENVVYLAVGMG